MQTVPGYSPLEAGAAYLPLTFGVAISAGVGAKLVTKVGSRAVICTGASIASGGLLLLAQVPVHGSYLPNILPWLARNRPPPNQPRDTGPQMTADHTDRSVLVLGRSQLVIEQAVVGLRDLGYTAQATNDFADITGRYDVEHIDMVVFGGQVPPEREAELKQEIGEINRRSGS
jgi:hypothetical protein